MEGANEAVFSRGAKVAFGVSTIPDEVFSNDIFLKKKKTRESTLKYLFDYKITIIQNRILKLLKPTNPLFL